MLSVNDERAVFRGFNGCLHLIAAGNHFPPLSPFSPFSRQREKESPLDR